MKKLQFILLFALVTGCATHPHVSTSRMKAGETHRGFVFSLENVFPYYFHRIALTDQSTLGFRVGIPIYGSGIDYSRILTTRDRRWDLLNLAWSFNPNSNIDATYYKFYQGKPKKDKSPSVFWWGLRGMYIPKGIMGRTSSRVGGLIGYQFSNGKGFEFGYFHDPTAMPISQVFSPSWRWDDPLNKPRYGDNPHIDPVSGLPSEYSRLTGLSFQFFLTLGK